MLLFLIFLAFLSVAFGGGCPPNSIGLQQNSSICYSFHPENLQYVAAEQACNSFGATLVSINDNYTNVYITQLSNVSFKKLGNEKFWANGHRLIGTKPLYPYIPPEVQNNKADVTDGCMAVDLETGDEKFEDCFQRLPYVCQFFADAGKQVPDGQPDIQRIAANKNATFETTTTALEVPTTTTSPMPETTPSTTLDPIITETTTIESPTTPERPSLIWEYFNATNSFYKGYGGGNWSFTEKWCIKQGAHLTSIHSKDEAVFVASMIPYNDFAVIGLRGTENGWEWSDGSPVDYLLWIEGEPNKAGGSEYCGLLWIGQPLKESDGRNINIGDFSTFPCTERQSFSVCKKKAI